jgi:hypothetical protein
LRFLPRGELKGADAGWCLIPTSCHHACRPPGPEWLRVAIERLFVDTIPAQHKGLQQVLRDFPADVIIGDDMIFGVLPMLLGPRSKRPPIVLCGTSFLHWHREDGAPHFAGLPPATTQAQLKKYAAISQEHDRVVNQPLARRLNRSLEDLGVGPLSTTLFDSVVELADAYDVSGSARQKSQPRNGAGEIFITAAAEIAHATVSAANRFGHETGNPRKYAKK